MVTYRRHFERLMSSNSQTSNGFPKVLRKFFRFRRWVVWLSSQNILPSTSVYKIQCAFCFCIGQYSRLWKILPIKLGDLVDLVGDCRLKHLSICNRTVVVNVPEYWYGVFVFCQPFKLVLNFFESDYDNPELWRRRSPTHIYRGNFQLCSSSIISSCVRVWFASVLLFHVPNMCTFRPPYGNVSVIWILRCFIQRPRFLIELCFS